MLMFLESTCSANCIAVVRTILISFMSDVPESFESFKVRDDFRATYLKRRRHAASDHVRSMPI
jgi:hypothetical protein